MPPVAALIVRQDSSRCQAAAEELRACGFDATEALSIEAGLALLAERPFDLIVCDAEERCPRQRPVWQSVLAITINRETIVAVLGPSNSHLEMLAACAGSRLALVSTSGDESFSRRAGDILLQRTGLVAALHEAEGLAAPRFAETRVPDRELAN